MKPLSVYESMFMRVRSDRRSCQGDDRGELIRFRAQKGKRKKSFTSFAEGGLRLDEPLHQRQMINWEIDHDCYTDDDEMKKGKYSL